MKKGTTVQTPDGVVGTVAGVYEQGEKTICVVKLANGTEAFPAAKLTVVTTAATGTFRPRRCEAHLDAKYRNCRNKATIQTSMGWVCCKHTGEE
jgi:hypothetical protein